jgi:hypothetical protein
MIDGLLFSINQSTFISFTMESKRQMYEDLVPLPYKQIYILTNMIYFLNQIMRLYSQTSKIWLSRNIEHVPQITMIP